MGNSGTHSGSQQKKIEKQHYIFEDDKVLRVCGSTNLDIFREACVRGLCGTLGKYSGGREGEYPGPSFISWLPGAGA